MGSTVPNYLTPTLQTFPLVCLAHYTTPHTLTCWLDTLKTTPPSRTVRSCGSLVPSALPFGGFWTGRTASGLDVAHIAHCLLRLRTRHLHYRTTYTTYNPATTWFWWCSRHFHLYFTLQLAGRTRHTRRSAWHLACLHAFLLPVRANAGLYKAFNLPLRDAARRAARRTPPCLPVTRRHCDAPTYHLRLFTIWLQHTGVLCSILAATCRLRRALYPTWVRLVFVYARLTYYSARPFTVLSLAHTLQDFLTARHDAGAQALPG